MAHKAFLFMAIALGGVGGTVFAQGVRSTPVSSEESDALDTRDEWECQKIYPEYRSFLDEGNDPKDWKFAGKFYRDVRTGALYQWSDWIDWANDAKCNGQTPLPQPEALPIVGPLIAAAIAGSNAGLIGVQQGSGPMSPG